MKQYKFLNRFFFITVLAISVSNFTYSQDKNDDKKEVKKEHIQQLIQNKSFAFIAQSANPMGGRFINLTSSYDVRVSGDSLLSDLPYFGRAYQAPVNPTESALRFTATNFNYNIKERKKGGWDITIIPKDAKDVRQMFLSVSEEGYATLQVVSNNRQPISFNGYVKERKLS